MKHFALTLLLSCSFLLISCSGEKSDQQQNDETTNATTDWITLFDGNTFDGWKVYGSDSITSEWEIIDGAIVCHSGAGEENRGFSPTSLRTLDTFGNFEFELEYKIGKGGNSGIFYHVVESDEYGYDFQTGPEYQVLDDEFSRSESEPFKMVGSNYAMHAPTVEKQINPYMQWNKVKIVYDNGRVEHWLNGIKLLEFEEGSDAWKALKAKSKWAETESYAKYKTGSFSLQNHGDEVHYRNIRVRKL